MMQPPSDFRTRVRAVRMESKSFLQSVRAERLARLREAMAGPAPAPTAFTAAIVEAPADDLGPMPEAAAAADAPNLDTLTVSANAARLSRLAQESAVQVAEHVHIERAVVPSPAETPPEPSSDPTMVEAAPVVVEWAEEPEGEVAEEALAEGPSAPESLTGIAATAEAELEAEIEPMLEVDVHLPVEADDPSVSDDTPDLTVEAPVAAQRAVFRLVQPSIEEAGESDLQDLPGVGPGLIWMLAKLGVHSQADLARSDADDLSNRLGVVGQLLDLRCWIARARENIGMENTAA